MLIGAFADVKALIMTDQTVIRRKNYWWRRDNRADSCSVHMMPGTLCPECGCGTLSYDGLFILSCEECGYIAASGAFT